MNFLKPIVLVTSILVFQNSLAQEIQWTKKDSTITNSWIFGVGFNAVDDAGSEFSNLLGVSENWNITPFPSRLSIGKYFESGLGLEVIGSYNVYKEGKIVDGAVNTEDIDYFAIDFRANYDLNQILGETGWFDPYVGVGVGYADANNQGRGTFNANVGFRTWFSDRWGLDFSSTGKWTMNSDNSTNHIQHAAGVVYRFGIEKGLSKKGEEKQKQLEELAEQQRIQDSIAAAEEAERAARELAERLKREEEAAKLAAAEEAKRKEAQKQRDDIAAKIKALGNVYFDLNSSYLTKKDKTLLSTLAQILKENPEVMLRVTSHTDARGTDNYNLWLSERRLKRTVAQLMDEGVSEKQLQTDALGEKELTNDCTNGVYCTDEKHRENRRTEFEVLWIDN